MPNIAPSLLHPQKNACVTLRLSSLPSHCTSIPSYSPQALAPVRHETRSATALAHSAELPGHNPIASKPPAQRRESPPLLSRPTPLHVAPPAVSRRSGLSRILGRRETLALGRCCRPCETLTLGRCCRFCETLALGRYCSPYKTLTLGRCYSRNFHVSSRLISADRVSRV